VKEESKFSSKRYSYEAEEEEEDRVETDFLDKYVEDEIEKIPLSSFRQDDHLPSIMS
jgi:hypothetical protein